MCFVPSGSQLNLYLQPPDKCQIAKSNSTQVTTQWDWGLQKDLHANEKCIICMRLF